MKAVMHRRLHAAMFIAVLFACSTSFTGCVSNPIAEAETEGQTYAAVTDSYENVLETMLELMADPRVPDQRKAAIRAVEAEVTPVFDELDQAYIEVLEVRAGVRDVGSGTSEAQFTELLEGAFNAYERLAGLIDR